MPEELLERPDLPEAPLAPGEEISSVPPVPPEALDTVLYEHDERASRADLRRQIAAMELELARLFEAAFPRRGLVFRVPGVGGPRLLTVDELERVRDSLAVRVQDVQGHLDDHVNVETRNRELIEEMVADPAGHKWIQVSNEDIGEPGCKHWHSRPQWGLLGMLAGWWRVKVSSGCPLAKGLRPPDQLMATRRQRRKRRQRQSPAERAPARPASPVASANAPRTARSGAPEAPWGSFPLSELVVLIGLILLVAGFFVGGQRGGVMMIVGLVLGSLGGLELAVREHFAGYKSHTLLLSAAVGLAVLVLLVLVTSLHPAICAGAAALACGGSAWLFVTAFRRRSGGALYRIKA